MVGFIKKILRMSALVIVVPGLVFGAQQPNPRSATNSRNVSRSADSDSSAAIRRSATSVIARSAALDQRQSRTVVTARPVAVRGATVRSARSAVKGANITRAATTSARSGTKVKSGANVSRAGSARVTAVFNDVSKIGGGYAGCRDSYATCMDQMCANANDTYRRCFCSDRFISFRETSDRLDEAVRLLAEFQNVNLDVVNKTAAEVNAMYTATEGEAAIKRDTSASQKLLDSISDVLSGKKTYQAKKGTASVSSLGVLDFSSLSSGVGDVFSDSSSVFSTGSSSLFRGTSSYSDISSLEGADLYNGAMQQCTQVTRDSCGGDAMFNLARSAYAILITQDCNAYEKNINAKKAQLEETVRTAEKYLREARLAEYRAHNSSDVNACLSAVDSAMRQPNACGENYGWCLDYTGLYIKPATGEPVYSQALFGLTDLITLSGSEDILNATANQPFNKFLESKKVFAESALDTCRGIADTVWEEYKRMALIQIAQAQDEKIEEVKQSCVDVVKECYDRQTGALNSLSEEVSKAATRAISATVASDMCRDKVLTCAALYGDTDGCAYNDKTKTIEAGNNNKRCGLNSLLTMVDAVDSVRISKGCEESLREYVAEICAPAAGDTTHTSPWGCRLVQLKSGGESLQDMLEKRAETYCSVENSAKTNDKFSLETDNIIKRIVDDVENELNIALASECEDLGGVWEYDSALSDKEASDLSSFYVQVLASKTELYSGKCKENSVRAQCLAIGSEKGYKTTYNSMTKTCSLPDKWFEDKCHSLGGYYADDICYVPDED